MTSGSQPASGSGGTDQSQAMLDKLQELMEKNYEITRKSSEIKYQDKNIDKTRYGG